MTNNTDGFVRALNSRYALIGMQKTMRRALLHLPKDDYCSVIVEYFVLSSVSSNFIFFCFLSKISEIGIINLDEGRIGFPVSKRTPYRKIVSMFLMKVREHGIISKEQEYVTTMPNCYEVSLFNSASFFDVFGAFCVFFIGIFISVLICKFG